MDKFHRTHAALFDELERQGIGHVDVGRLTRAVLNATDIVAAAQGDWRPHGRPSRCVNGFCDE